MVNGYGTLVRSTRSPNDPPELPVLFYVGVAVYLLSFGLPAVTMGALQFPGWRCAWYALDAWRIQEASKLAVFGGLINPLAAFYLWLRLLKVAPDFELFCPSQSSFAFCQHGLPCLAWKWLPGLVTSHGSRDLPYCCFQGVSAGHNWPT